MSKIVSSLVGTQIDKAHREKVIRSLSDGAMPGLEFRVGLGGSSWSVVANGPLGRKRFTLGSYPDMTLAAARAAAAQAKKRHLTSADQTRSTLNELVEDFGKVEGGRLRTWREQSGMMRKVFADVMATPCGKLDVRRLQRIVDNYHSKAMAVRTLSFLGVILKWGRRRGYVDFDVRDVERPKGASKPRKRVLSADELGRVVPYLRANLATQPYRIMWLLLLTACRRDEIANATWENITLGAEPVLRVPPERSKNGEALTIPLTPQAVEALGEPGSGRVFSVQNNWARYQNRIHADTQTLGWHRHDLRRTTATVAGERLAYPPHIVDAILGHMHLGPSDVHSIYNRSRYLPEQRACLQAVADYYCQITTI